MAVDRADDIGSRLPADSNDTKPLDPTRNREPQDLLPIIKPPKPTEIDIPQDAEVGAQVNQFRLQSIGNDLYGAVTYVAGVPGTTFSLAKPWFLRRNTFDGQTVGGRIYTYIDSTSRKVEIESSGQVFFETIIPEYAIGDELMYASSVDATEVDGALELIELNTNGHHWSRTSTRRVKIQSIPAASDYVVCIEISNAGVETGDPFNVALPYKIQATPWTGKTIVTNLGLSISYVHAGNQFRTATLASGPFIGSAENQTIIPGYLVDDYLTVVQPSNGTGVLVNEEQVVWQDINESGRMWARSEVVT